MNLDQEYTIDKDRVIYRVIGDEAVILEARTGYSYGFNEVGTSIWEALDSGMKPIGLIRHLAQRYEASEPILKADLVKFIASIEKEGLLQKGKQGSGRGGARPQEKKAAAKPKAKRKYTAPSFEKYHEIKRARSVA